ncbi:uncharacterized protein LOC133913465 isoform X2 [Phragmites australis]|uniref:uncharacterized protein LOC133913465 isoform X2 n=1 Tax=Phragmites australis TaxID=29695 RepID=UPI002D786F1B|nr:uncharacterized protein LOC133913465 isoform X2 [Phragmites australis]
MANLPPSLSIGAPSTPAPASAPAPAASMDRNMATAEQLVLDLCNPDLRENALLDLSKKRENFQDLAPLIWHSFGTIAALLQEIVSIYPSLSPATLSPGQSNRVCNALALLQVDDPEVIAFLLKTEIIPLCLRTMEMGSELSKTVATFIVQKILLDDTGLLYACATAERFFAVANVLAQMVEALAEQPSPRLLKHIIRCYLRLTDNARACAMLNSHLPSSLKDGTFNDVLQNDLTTRRWLLQLLHNIMSANMGGGPHAGLDHIMGM